MWNTWSRTTKATAFGTNKTNSISTKRWKNSSTNICIQRPQLLRARLVQHQHEAKHDPQNWKNRTLRNAERAWPIRVGAPQDDDAEANENEGEERSDICKVSQRTDIDYGGDAADKNARPNGGDVWGPKSRMNAGKVLREQAIT